jgi:hypothetical protein
MNDGNPTNTRRPNNAFWIISWSLTKSENFKMPIIKWKWKHNLLEHLGYGEGSSKGKIIVMGSYFRKIRSSQIKTWWTSSSEKPGQA